MNVGKVLAYSDDVGRGVIICEDAKKYNFDVQDWDSFESSPKVGMQVSFDLSEQNEPLRIRIVSDIETYTPSSDVVDLDAKEIEIPKKSYNDLGMQNCIDAFFVFFEDEIRDDKHLRLESKELDFLKIKRFLYTAYNNLLEIDTGFENYILADIKNSLDKYYELYKKFKNQTKYMKTTFERVFLDKQEEYKKLIVDIEINKKELNNLKNIVETNEAEFESDKKKLVKLETKSLEYQQLYKLLKQRKRRIVDAIHEATTIREANRELIDKAQKFYDINYTPFVEIFHKKSIEFEQNIIKILNVLAYKLDSVIWQNANASENVKQFFKNAGITTKFSSATYLKYYINSLDMSKLNEENHELLDLLHYLEKKEQSVVAIFSDEVESVQAVEALVREIKDEVKVIVATRESVLMRDLKNHTPTTLIINPLAKGCNCEKVIANLKYLYPQIDIGFICENLNKQLLLTAKKFHVSVLIQTNDTHDNKKKKIEALLE